MICKCIWMSVVYWGWVRGFAKPNDFADYSSLRGIIFKLSHNIRHLSNNLRRLKAALTLLHDIRNLPRLSTTYHRHRGGSRDVVVLIRLTINNVPPSTTSTIHPRHRWSLLRFAKTRDNMRAVLAEASRRETHTRFIAFHCCASLSANGQTATREREMERESPFPFGSSLPT